MTARQQLQWWREATGRNEPGAPVRVGVEVHIGRCDVTFYGDKLPQDLMRALFTGAPRKRPLKPAVALVTLTGPRTSYRSGQTIDRAQRAAYNAAMSAGRWAA